MKTVKEFTLLEVVEQLEEDTKGYAYEYGEEISDEWQERIDELKRFVIENDKS